ncbi:MAG: ABC transporter permease [Thermoleophilia bacterium]|nr:ABC transporter permease [Thermoleophilia bacterium]
MSAAAEAPALRPARRHRPLLSFFARRLPAALATLLAVSVLVFAGTEVLPGDAASAVLGRTATPAQLAEMQELMGLDRPAHERYFDWLRGVASGDLGNSAAGYAAGGEAPIWNEVAPKIGNSFILAGLTALAMVPLALLLGVAAAVRTGRTLDHAVSLSTLAVISLPEFIIGSLLVLVFFSWLDVLPPLSLVPPGTSPLARPEALVLPVLTLLGASLAASIRMVRAGMVETLGSEYVTMARLNGFPERAVVLRYALRNALAPSVQVFAQNIQYLVGGIVVTEYLFNYPGLGKELVDAVAIRDVREVQSVALLVAAFYVTLNIVADFLVVLLTPKLRTQA